MEVEVRTGDSLYAIAARELGDGNRWPELWRLNEETITGEHRRRGVRPREPEALIYAGMRLTVPESHA